MKQGFRDWIIYEDDRLMAINKPAGIPALDERSGEGISVIRLAREYDPDSQLCHRIDKETSGVLLIARDNETYKACAQLFRERQIMKTYLAVSEGRHQFDDLVVELPLSTTTRGKARVDMREGKPAETKFTTIRTFGHYTLIACTPVTGRLHQIRIHLASQNAVIAGDTAYGGHMPFLSSLKRNFNLGKGREESPMIRRVALHAWKLEFGLDGKQYNIEAGEPKDFTVFMKQLDKFDSLGI